MNAFTISLPDSTPPAKQDELEAALQDMPSVEGAGVSETRGIDPQAVMIWVKLAGEMIATAGAMLPVLQKVVDMIRGKGIKGAKINLPGGATLQVDEASTADIERLMRTAAGT